MTIRYFKPAWLLCIAILFVTPHAIAQTLDTALALPDRLLFTISGGYWTKNAEEDGNQTQERGYYRLSAFRDLDNTSVLFLQKIALTDDGPKEDFTIEIEEMADLNAYITDMRPENSTGSVSGTGFAAYIYLKMDPKDVEPETYSLYIDDLENIYLEPASN